MIHRCRRPALHLTLSLLSLHALCSDQAASSLLLDRRGNSLSLLRGHRASSCPSRRSHLAAATLYQPAGHRPLCCGAHPRPAFSRPCPGSSLLNPAGQVAHVARTAPSGQHQPEVLRATPLGREVRGGRTATRNVAGAEQGGE